MAKQKPKEKFSKVNAQLGALHDEVGNLSKRKPDDAVNEFKLLLINEVIKEANNILEEDYKPFSNFTIFDKDDMPTNSDVVLILSQYLRCLHRQQIDNDSLLRGF